MSDLGGSNFVVSWSVFSNFYAIKNYREFGFCVRKKCCKRMFGFSPLQNHGDFVVDIERHDYKKRLWNDYEFHELLWGNFCWSFSSLSIYAILINKSNNIVSNFKKQISHKFLNEINHFNKWGLISKVCKRFLFQLDVLEPSTSLIIQ
jgi:hypothetical protein